MHQERKKKKKETTTDVINGPGQTQMGPRPAFEVHPAPSPPNQHQLQVQDQSCLLPKQKNAFNSSITLTRVLIIHFFIVG